MIPAKRWSLQLNVHRWCLTASTPPHAVANPNVTGDLDPESAEAGGLRTNDRLSGVRVVTAEEAAAGLFDIEDVVLPLPGLRIRYPEHETAQVKFCLLLVSEHGLQQDKVHILQIGRVLRAVSN